VVLPNQPSLNPLGLSTAPAPHPLPRLPPRRPAHRSLFIAALTALGFALARLAPFAPSSRWLLLAAALSAAGLFSRGPWRRLTLTLAVVALAGGWFTLRALERPASDIAPLLTDSPTLLSVEGMILDAPQIHRRRPGKLAAFLPPLEPSTTFRMRVRRILPSRGATAFETSGELRVFLSDKDSDGALAAGRFLRVTGMAQAVTPATNPGEPDRTLWARTTGLSGSIHIENAALVELLPTPDNTPDHLRAWWLSLAAGARARASAWLTTESVPSESRALMRALFLGQRDDSLRNVSDAFTRLGLAHVLAISGLHLVFLAWALRQVVRLPGARPWLEALIVAAIIAAYLLVIPVHAPALRAAITAVGFLIADASGRRYDRITTLGWVFIATLLWQPMELFSPGFQLSFGVVAALLILAAPLRRKLFGESPSPDSIGSARRSLEWSKDAVAASICAWAIASPLIALHMGNFAPMGALATILFMPLVALLMSLGYLAMLLSVALPAAGASAVPLAQALDPLAALIARFAHLLDSATGLALTLPSVGVAWTIAATATIAWWLAPIRFDAPRRLIYARRLATFASCAWLAFTLSSVGLPRSVALRIDTIDVSDGSCHLIRVGRDALLFDCGSLRLDIGQRELPSALRALGVWRVSTVILSHPNIDHYAALPDLVLPLGVRRVLIGEAFAAAASHSPRGPVAATLDALRVLGVEVRVVAASERLSLGDATVEILSPHIGARWKTDNDASLVALFSVPTTDDLGQPRVSRLLMCGDIQRAAMISLLHDHPKLHADIMEAPHHGSAHPAAYDFVRAVAPRLVLQSTGPSRKDDPRWNLVRANLDWLATPSQGALSATIAHDSSIKAWGWRKASAPAPAAPPDHQPPGR